MEQYYYCDFLNTNSSLIFLYLKLIYTFKASDNTLLVDKR